MHKLGKKHLVLQLAKKLKTVPAELKAWNLELSEDGKALNYFELTAFANDGALAITLCLTRCDAQGLDTFGAEQGAQFPTFDIPGGQVLGPTYDYTHRLLDFSLAASGERPQAPTAPVDSETPGPGSAPT